MPGPEPLHCFVATQQGRVIGAILAGHDGRRGYIGHTAVAPAFQRRGIGRRLVEAAVDALRAEGIHKVNLVVFAPQPAGQRLLGEDGIYPAPGPDLPEPHPGGHGALGDIKKHSHAGYNFPLKKPGIFIKS